MERYWSDVRVSLRIFRRSPALSVSAAIALAMGIGFTTTMFSIVRGGTRSLPFENPDQIVALTRTAVRGNNLDSSPFDYLAWSRAQRSYTGLGAFEEQNMVAACTAAPNPIPATPAPAVQQASEGPPLSRSQVLLGEYARYRANNDVLYYRLDIRLDPEKKFLSGKNMPARSPRVHRARTRP